MDEIQQAKAWLAANPNHPDAAGVRQALSEMQTHQPAGPATSTIAKPYPDPATLKGNVRGLGTAAQVGIPLAAGLATGGMGFLPGLLAQTAGGVAGGLIGRGLKNQPTTGTDVGMDAALSAGPGLAIKGAGMALGGLARAASPLLATESPGFLRSLLIRGAARSGGINPAEKITMLGKLKTPELAGVSDEALSGIADTARSGRQPLSAASAAADQLANDAPFAREAAQSGVNEPVLRRQLGQTLEKAPELNQALIDAIAEARGGGGSMDPAAISQKIAAAHKSGAGVDLKNLGGSPDTSADTLRMFNEVASSPEVAGNPNVWSAAAPVKDMASRASAIGESLGKARSTMAESQRRLGYVPTQEQASGMSSDATGLNQFVRHYQPPQVPTNPHFGDAIAAASVVSGHPGYGFRYWLGSRLGDAIRPTANTAAKAIESTLMNRGLDAASPVLRQQLSTPNYPAVLNQAGTEWLRNYLYQK